MKLRSFAALLGLYMVLTFGIPALACLWIYGTNIEGKTIEVEGHSSHLHAIDPSIVLAEWKQKISVMEPLYKPDADYKVRSDYAAALIHVGQSRKAIEILDGVELSNPGLYATAANLGTAYELSGDNEKAMHWIKEAIKRNKDSHEGTEWVHVRILEVKLELAKNPDWLKQNSVLGLNFGSEKRPLMPALPVKDYQGNEIKPADVISAAQYQLHERLQFVAPPDPIVADMLFDIGNYTAATSIVEEAAKIYTLALKFDHPRREAVQARLDFVESIPRLDQKMIPNKTARTLAWVLVGCLFIAAFFGILKLLRRNRTA